jgi:hypothetical protein
MKEYILCSAVWFEEFDNQYNETVKEQSRPKNITKGVVICGQRHLQCIRTFSYIVGKRAVQTEVGKSVQGFITNLNRFVDREEVGKIAFEAEQIEELKRCLYSEDLW